MPTLNLGQVQALWISTNPPTNTAMLWYDINTGVFLQKYYNIQTSTWDAFAQYTVTLPLEQSGGSLILLYEL